MDKSSTSEGVESGISGAELAQDLEDKLGDPVRGISDAAVWDLVTHGFGGCVLFELGGVILHVLFEGYPSWGRGRGVRIESSGADSRSGASI